MSTITPEIVADVRDLVATALAERVAQVDTETDRRLLIAMADNVKAWTHTTRLREFLQTIDDVEFADLAVTPR